MKPIYIYPGTFCPPTIGHYEIVKRAARLFPKITIICSINPVGKKKLFTPEECETLWHAYDLPKNVEVKTLPEFLKTKPDFSKVMMIRGIRDKNDLKEENKIVTLNHEKYGIDKYVYLLSEKKFKHISASKARTAAANLELEKFSEYVSPLVASALLEKTLNIKNIFMVVGKPGAGKTTFLKMLSKMGISRALLNHASLTLPPSPTVLRGTRPPSGGGGRGEGFNSKSKFLYDKINYHNIYINTDDFNQKLKPLLKRTFGKEDLISVAINQKSKLRQVIEKPWLKLLKQSLKKVPPKSNVFIEIPYGLQPNKLMFEFVGGKIIYIGCENKKVNIQRLKSCNMNKLIPFIGQIPGKKETIKIAKKYNLDLIFINSNGTLKDLRKEAIILNKKLK